MPRAELNCVSIELDGEVSCLTYSAIFVTLNNSCTKGPLGALNATVHNHSHAHEL